MNRAIKGATVKHYRHDMHAWLEAHGRPLPPEDAWPELIGEFIWLYAERIAQAGGAPERLPRRRQHHRHDHRIAVRVEGYESRV